MQQGQRPGSRGARAAEATTARGLALAGLLGLVVLAAQAGCATVNVGSAQRLSEQALGATQALQLGLNGVRGDLMTYVEGQALLAPLTQRPPLGPSELCALEAVQRSLRLRLLALGKLLLAYDHFRALTVRETWAVAEPMIDELFTELDPADFPVDVPLATGCPTASPLPPRRDAALAPELVSPPSSLGLSQTRSIKVASARIRVLLGRLRSVLADERATIESVQRQLLESQRRIALTLLSRYDVLSPAPLLRPQLERLGLLWDDWAYADQRARWPKEQRDALQAALLAVLERRVAHNLALQSVLYEQQLAVLAALERLHLRLEAGQPFGVRDLAALVVPVLRSANGATASSPSSLGPSSNPASRGPLSP
jgi:hypothetical protein